jgi:methyl-accepting chemotaxis protein
MLKRYFKSLRGRLLLLSIIPILFFSGFLFFSLLSEFKIVQGSEVTETQHLPALQAIGKMEHSLNMFQRYFWLIRQNDEDLLNRSTPPDEVRKKISEFEEAKDRAISLETSDTGKEQLKSIGESWDLLKPILVTVLEAYSATGPESKEKKDKAHGRVEAGFGVLLSVFETVNVSIAQVRESKFDELKSFGNETTGRLSNLIRFSIGGYLFAIVLCVVLLTRTIRRLQDTISKFSEDLSVNSNSLSTESSAISDAGGRLNDSVSSQTEIIEQTVRSLHEILTKINLRSQSAKTAHVEADQLNESSRHGLKLVEAMLKAIEQVAAGNRLLLSRMDEAGGSMTRITKLVEEISTKTAIINEIVFQTRLLSFNASVEAERAGEMGRSFAVVASEVGNLAQMSGKAAGEISQLLDRSSREVSEIGKQTRQSVNEMRERAEQDLTVMQRTVQGAADAFSDITSNIGRLAEFVEDISLSTQIEAAGVGQINEGIKHLETATRDTKSISERSAEASVALQSESERAADLAESLQSLIKGAA